MGTDDISILLENLSQLASSTGIKIVSLKPAEITRMGKGALYSSAPIKMSALAGAYELGKFLVKLETNPVYFRVNGMRINENPGDPRKHFVELDIESFRRGR